jgi:site-specific DNA recombinase
VEQDFNEAGCEIEYVLGNYPATPEGGLMKHVGASIAEYERLKIAERTTRARRAIAQLGGVISHGKAPYGYRIVRGKREFAVNEDEARVVHQIFAWFTEDRQATTEGIIRKLDEAGIPPRKGGGRWRRSVIHRLLTREVYCGVWYYGKERWVNEDGKKKTVQNPTDYWIPVRVPAIIERETWLLAQRRLAENLENARRRKKYDYLLVGHAFCSCGSKVYGKSVRERSGNLFLYYRCPKCDLPYFRADMVDGAAWAWVRELLSNPDALVAGLEKRRTAQGAEGEVLRGRLAEVDAALARNKDKQRKLLDLFLKDNFSRELLMERNEELEAAAAALNRERRAVVSEIEARVLTDKQVESLREFISMVFTKLVAADGDFGTRREIIQILGVRVILSVESDQRIVRVMIDTVPGTLTNPGKPLTMTTPLRIMAVALSMSQVICSRRKMAPRITPIIGMM